MQFHSTKSSSSPLVLVTGASGFLASHIVWQLLGRGCRVRAAVRDVQQSSWLLKDRFRIHAEQGTLELVSAPDLSIDGGFDEAVKGVTAILHTAYITRIVPDPNEVITPSVAGIRSIIKSASKEPSVMRVVFTSSAMAASPLTQDADNGVIDDNSWNDAALEAAWAPPPYGMSHMMANYPASKLAAEKEVWKIVKEGQLPFTVNVVSPAGLIGEPLNEKHIEGQANWVAHAFRGNKALMDQMQASYYADVKDVALIHVAAALDPELKDTRIQSWGHSTHWNEILSILRKHHPERQFVDDYATSYHLQVFVEQSQSLALLQKWGGKEGWTSLEDGVVANVDNAYLA